MCTMQMKTPDMQAHSEPAANTVHTRANRTVLSFFGRQNAISNATTIKNKKQLKPRSQDANQYKLKLDDKVLLKKKGSKTNGGSSTGSDIMTSKEKLKKDHFFLQSVVCVFFLH